MCLDDHFGITFVLIQISAKDRLQRKKYIGMWSRDSEMTARMKSRFFRTVSKYMAKKRLKMMDCSSGSSVSPKRRICKTPVWFITSVYSINLVEKIQWKKWNVLKATGTSAGNM